jgi:polysaccharide biosynthesis PFTS motif protein
MINFKKNYRKKIRSCIREYNRLGRENNIQILRNLKRVLANEQLEYRFDKIDSLILGSKTFDIGLIIRQFLVQNYLGQSFIKEVLNGMDKNNKYPCYTIPPIWQKKLKSQGFKISVVKSNIKWNIAIFLRLLNGIFIFAVTFLRSLQNVFLSSAHIGGSVFFLDLRLNNLPNKRSSIY